MSEQVESSNEQPIDEQPIDEQPIDEQPIDEQPIDELWGQHCLIAIQGVEAGLSHEAANVMAAKIMQCMHGVDTAQHSRYRYQDLTVGPVQVPVVNRGYRVFNISDNTEVTDAYYIDANGFLTHKYTHTRVTDTELPIYNIYVSKGSVPDANPFNDVEAQLRHQPMVSPAEALLALDELLATDINASTPEELGRYMTQVIEQEIRTLYVMGLDPQELWDTRHE